MAEFKNREEYEKWKAEKARQAAIKSIEQSVLTQADTMNQTSSSGNKTTTTAKNDENTNIVNEQGVPNLQWYYSKDGHQFGPLPEDQIIELLKQKKITEQSLVWNASMTEWETVLTSKFTSLIRDPNLPPPLTGGAVSSKLGNIGSDLEGGASSKTAMSKPSVDYGMFLLAIPVIAIILIWAWVGNMNLLQSPGSTMTLIMLATVLGTAIVAAMEASKVGMKSDKTKGTYSPTAWFYIITLLWIIGYPVYLFKRKHFGLANHLVVGILIALIFVGSWGSMSSAIEAKKTEVRGNLEQIQRHLGPFQR